MLSNLINWILLKIFIKMDNLHESKHIIFQIKANSLVVYRIIPGSNVPQGSITYELYWSDPINMQGSGPFKTLWDAMSHYDYIIQDRKKYVSKVLAIVSPTTTSTNKVITVDFKSKKKILVIPS